MPALEKWIVCCRVMASVESPVRSLCLSVQISLLKDNPGERQQDLETGVESVPGAGSVFSGRLLRS